uniref:Tetraspanin n=1 Tax=Leptobrachium leishanense TaxID=445787 RepID=A0A8C5QJD3_9ANUR
MRVKDKIKVLTYFFVIFNLVLMILGLFNVICSIWLVFDKRHLISLLESVDKFSPFISLFSQVLMFEGVVIFVICLFGFLLLIREVKLFLMMYSGFLVLLFVMGCVDEVLLLMYFHDGLALSVLIEKMQEIIIQYRKPGFPENEIGWILVNSVQSKSNCCGIYNYTDWLENRNQIGPFNLPCSCSNSSTGSLFCELLYSAIFNSGCEDIISKWYYENVLSMTGLTVSRLVFELIQFAVTVALIKSTWMLCKVSQKP